MFSTVLCCGLLHGSLISTPIFLSLYITITIINSYFQSYKQRIFCLSVAIYYMSLATSQKAEHNIEYLQLWLWWQQLQWQQWNRYSLVRQCPGHLEINGSQLVISFFIVDDKKLAHGLRTILSFWSLWSLWFLLFPWCSCLSTYLQGVNNLYY